MIDLKVATLGGKEIADQLAQANSEIHATLRDELADIGQEITAEARARAPERTGILKSRILWYFGREVRRSRGPGRGKYTTIVETASKHAKQSTKDAWARSILLTVRPTGTVAHLMERGVNATFQQRAGAGWRKGSKPGQAVASIKSPKWQHARSLTYQRTLNIAPRPFFMPAVGSVGGAAGVNARLQARLDRIPRDVQAGAS